MIDNQIYFHNVASLEPAKGTLGVILQRFPKLVRDSLGTDEVQRGRYVANYSTGCEMRFVTASDMIRITLSAPMEGGNIIVYNGDFVHSIHYLPQGGVHTLHLEKNERFHQVDWDSIHKGRFSHEVWRVAVSRHHIASAGFTVVFHDLETFGHGHRPPHVNEMPSLQWIAYGSSITHGSGATMHHNAYVQHAARRLGVDVMNKGMGGSCFCEATMSEFLIQSQWDIATLELGVNMRELFTTEEFRARAFYLVDQMSRSGKPVFLITIYPNSAVYLHNTSYKFRKDSCEAFMYAPNKE